MIKCPQCGRQNEDGELFCEACKTDLAPAVPGFPPLPPPGMFVHHSESAARGSSTWDGSQHIPPGFLDMPAPAADAELVSALPLERRSHDLSAGKARAGREPAAATVPEPPASDSRPKLVVLRGEKVNVQYTIYPGHNYIGRTDEKPVDIDLENQEPPDRIWSSRQHAVITYENGALVIEDLNSLNGTFVNRTRIQPGQPRTLQPNDVIQIGTVQLKVVQG